MSSGSTTMQVPWPDRPVTRAPSTSVRSYFFPSYCPDAGAGCAGSVSAVGSGDGSQVLSEK